MSIFRTTKEPPLYTYTEVLELMAFAALPEATREKYTIDTFKTTFPDVFNGKKALAERILQHA